MLVFGVSRFVVHLGDSDNQERDPARISFSTICNSNDRSKSPVLMLQMNSMH